VLEYLEKFVENVLQGSLCRIETQDQDINKLWSVIFGSYFIKYIFFMLTAIVTRFAASGYTSHTYSNPQHCVNEFSNSGNTVICSFYLNILHIFIFILINKPVLFNSEQTSCDRIWQESLVRYLNYLCLFLHVFYKNVTLNVLLVKSDTRSTERGKELQSFPPRNHLDWHG
jgi:hypothetical protein